jgi:phenol 2-monooxygenase
MPHASDTDLLIVGAGPAGLMAACWAAEFGLSARIIDEKADRVNTGHADGIQSRTLEIFDSFGFADTILERAVVQKEMCHWVGVSDPNEK